MARGTLRFGIDRLADVAGGGLERRRGEADQVEAGHHRRQIAEPAGEGRCQVKVDRLPPVDVAAQDRERARKGTRAAPRRWRSGSRGASTHLMPHRLTAVKSEHDARWRPPRPEGPAGTTAGSRRPRAARSARRSAPSPTSSRCRSAPRAPGCRAGTPPRRRRRCRRPGSATSGPARSRPARPPSRAARRRSAAERRRCPAEDIALADEQRGDQKNHLVAAAHRQGGRADPADRSRMRALAAIEPACWPFA